MVLPSLIVSIIFYGKIQPPSATLLSSEIKIYSSEQKSNNLIKLQSYNIYA